MEKGIEESVLGICIIWFIVLGVMVNRVSPDETHDGSLAGKVVGLTLQGELGEVIGLGEHVKWNISLPEFNLVTLV
jgi:hypothetical protein